jgi:hypothetical protein
MVIFLLPNVVILAYVVVMMIVLLQWRPPIPAGDPLAQTCDAFANFTVSVSYKVYQGIVNIAQQFITVAILVFGMRIVWTLNLLRSTSGTSICTCCCKGKMQCRLMTAMTVSALCFALHFIMSVVAVAVGPQNNDWIDQNVWYFLDYWIPTIPPACLMLFLMRNVHRGDLEVDDEEGFLTGNRFHDGSSGSGGSGASGDTYGSYSDLRWRAHSRSISGDGAFRSGTFDVERVLDKKGQHEDGGGESAQSSYSQSFASRRDSFSDTGYDTDAMDDSISNYDHSRDQSFQR